jgi:hypothetical protein
MLEFSRRRSQLNPDSALQLARSLLTNLGIDLIALEAKSTPDDSTIRGIPRKNKKP